MISRAFKYVLLLFLIFSTNAAAADQAPMLDPAVRRGTLANGLRYFLMDNKNDGGKVEIRFVVRAGSGNDPYAHPETAHFVEHLVASSMPPGMPAKTVPEWVTGWGGTVGNDWNATTSEDRTIYILSLPVDRPDIIREGLQIQRHWAGMRDLGGQSVVDRERAAVTAELSRNQSQNMRIQDRIVPAILDSGSTAYRTTDDRLAATRSATIDIVSAFHDKWYRPDNAAIVIVGDIDVDRMEAEVERLFGDLAKPSSPLPAPPATFTPRPEQKLLLLRDPEQQRPQVFRYAVRRAVIPAGEAQIREIAKGLMLDAALYSRDAKLVTGFDPSIFGGDPFGYATQSSAGVTMTSTAFARSVSARPGELEKALTSAVGVWSAAVRDGFSDDEVESARQNVLRRQVGVPDENGQLEPITAQSWVGRIISYFIDGTMAPSQDTERAIWERTLAAISGEDLRVALKKWKDEKDRLYAVVVPERDRVPARSNVLKWIAQAENYVPPREPPLPSVDSIGPVIATIPEAPPYSVTHFPEAGVVRLTLANKITVLLRPFTEKGQDPTAGRIQISAWSPFGTERYTGSDYLDAQVATDLGTRTGLPGIDELGVMRLLQERSLWFAPIMGGDSVEFTGGAPRTEFERLLKILVARFTTSSRHEEAYRGWLKLQREILARKKAGVSDPLKRFSEAIQGQIRRDPSERPTLTLENVDQVDYARTLEIFEERFANAGDFVFTVTGRFEPDDIIPLLARYLSALPSTGPGKLFATDASKQLVFGSGRTTVKAAVNGNASVSLLFVADGKWDLAAVANARMVEMIVRGRLLDRLREREQGTYAVLTGFTPMRASSESIFRIDFDCAPEKVEQLIAAAREELDHFRSEGPTKEEVDGAWAAVLSARANRPLTTWGWTSFMNWRYLEANGSDAIFEPEDAVPPSRDVLTHMAIAIAPPAGLREFVMLPKDDDSSH